MSDDNPNGLLAFCHSQSQPMDAVRANKGNEIFLNLKNLDFLPVTWQFNEKSPFDDETCEHFFGMSKTLIVHHWP